MKIIDRMNESIASGKTFYSFEFFPPRTDEVISYISEEAASSHVQWAFGIYGNYIAP